MHTDDINWEIFLIDIIIIMIHVYNYNNLLLSFESHYTYM